MQKEWKRQREGEREEEEADEEEKEKRKNIMYPLREDHCVSLLLTLRMLKHFVALPLPLVALFP